MLGTAEQFVNGWTANGSNFGSDRGCEDSEDDESGDEVIVAVDEDAFKASKTENM